MKHYKIMSIIGQGSFGSVFKVKDSKKRVLAVKSMKTDTHTRRHACKREIEILKTCQQSYVVLMVGEAWSAPAKCGEAMVDHTFIAMEFAPMTLQDLIDDSGKPSRLEVKVISSIMHQMLSGMAYVHSKGIIHRDLKPDNVLMTSNGVAKIADFGLSCYEKFGEVKNSVVGTFGFISPEQLLGATNYSYPADCWSLGCILSELFTGEQLIRGDTQICQISAILDMFGPIKREEIPDNMDVPLLEFIRQPEHGKAEKQLNMFLAFQRDRYVLNLALKLFNYNPEERISCDEALLHPFITSWKETDMSVDPNLRDAKITNGNFLFEGSLDSRQNESMKPATSSSPDFFNVHASGDISGDFKPQLVEECASVDGPSPLPFHQDTAASPCMNADQILSGNCDTDDADQFMDFIIGNASDLSDKNDIAPANISASSGVPPNFLDAQGMGLGIPQRLNNSAVVTSDMHNIHAPDNHVNLLNSQEDSDNLTNPDIKSGRATPVNDFAWLNLPECNLFTHGNYQNIAQASCHPYDEDDVSRNYNSDDGDDYMDFVLNKRTSDVTMDHIAMPGMFYMY